MGDAQHFLNALFMIFIIRAGLQILADHARLYWTRHCTPGRDWFRFQKPVPADQPLWTAKQDSVSLPGQVGLPGLRHSIGLARWWHLGTDMLWLVNGALFYVLLFTTGQWHLLGWTALVAARVDEKPLIAGPGASGGSGPRPPRVMALAGRPAGRASMRALLREAGRPPAGGSGVTIAGFRGAGRGWQRGTGPPRGTGRGPAD